MPRSHPGDGLQVALGQATNAQCAQPAAPQAGNGACDQFGAACRMWECPDAFDMGNGTWAFKWSDQVSLQCTHLPLPPRIWLASIHAFHCCLRNASRQSWPGHQRLLSALRQESSACGVRSLGSRIWRWAFPLIRDFGGSSAMLLRAV